MRQKRAERVMISLEVGIMVFFYPFVWFVSIEIVVKLGVFTFRRILGIFAFIFIS